MTIGDGKAAASAGVAVRMRPSGPRICRAGARAALTACCLAAWWKAGPVGGAAQFTGLVLRTGPACAKASASALRAAADKPAGRRPRFGSERGPLARSRCGQRADCTDGTIHRVRSADGTSAVRARAGAAGPQPVRTTGWVRR